MPSNPALQSATQESLSRLAGWETLEVAGRDAAAFLQRQTMNDVAALRQTGGAQWSGILSAKGRLQALFICARLSDERYWLISPDLPAAALGDLLQRYVLRSKLSLTVRVEVLAAGCWQPGDAAQEWHPVECRSVADDSLEIHLPSETGGRLLRLGTDCARITSESDAAINERWRLDDLRCGLPRLALDQQESWTPHMLGLQRLDAFSLKKGCYPGQEIVARTHYLGRSKRGLQRFDAESAIPEGAPVVDIDGSEVGNTICNASWRDHHTALLIIAADAQPKAARTSAGVLLFPKPFACAVSRQPA